MKNLAVVLMVVLGINSIYSQSAKSNGFISDNFSLEGALQIFKQSNTMEEFENSLNNENSNVNNLDLNNDGYIDYLTVSDYQDKDVHVIVISTYLDKNERQDIATIELERKGVDNAIVQIVGDEDLFGKDVYVEPFDNDERLDRSKGGPNVTEIVSSRIIINVWGWPCVRFIYSPRYVLWASPFRWSYYPKWWKPWRPYQYTVFVNRCAPHRHYYHYVPNNRIVYARNVYEPYHHRSEYIHRNDYNHYERHGVNDRDGYRNDSRMSEHSYDRNSPRNNGRYNNYPRNNEGRNNGRMESRSDNRNGGHSESRENRGHGGNEGRKGRRQ